MFSTTPCSRKKGKRREVRRGKRKEAMRDKPGMGKETFHSWLWSELLVPRPERHPGKTEPVLNLLYACRLLTPATFYQTVLKPQLLQK